MKDKLFTNCSQLAQFTPRYSLISPAQTAELLLSANVETAPHGLMLTESEAKSVAEARRESLLAAGRVDFAGDLPAKIARRFCDSPNIHQSEWAETIMSLVDLFYDTKNAASAASDAMADDALLDRMRRWFDDPAGGSLERLADLLEAMVERIQWGLSPDEPDRRGTLLDGMDPRDWLSRRGDDLEDCAEGNSPVSNILDFD
jgi:hypothetical protein